jgi:hypothetical protein
MIDLSGYISQVVNCLKMTLDFFYILMLFIIITLLILGVLEIVSRCKCEADKGK